MTTAREIDTRKAVLRARGVPERFVDSLATRKGAGGTLLAVMGVALVVVAAMVVALLTVIFQIGTFAHALLGWLHAGAASALLFQGSDTFGLVIMLGTLLLSIIGLQGAIRAAAGNRFRPWPAYDPAAIALRTLKTGETLETVKVMPGILALGEAADEEAFLQAVRPGPARLSAGALLVVIALIFGVVIVPMGLDTMRYRIVTTDSIAIHDLGGMKTYRLAEAHHAYVLCSDDLRSDGFAYRVVFADRTIDLWAWRDEVHDLDASGVFGRLQIIDKRLRTLGVSVHHMPAGEGQACVKGMVRRLDLRDAQAFERLVYGS